MTIEEKQKAINALKISVPVMVVTNEEFNDYIQIRNKTIDWLKQEPCEDAISREAVIDALYDMEILKYRIDLENVIKALPPVIPQSKTRWIPVSERLPEIRFDINSRTSDTVFVCLENSTRHMAFYCDDSVWRFCESGEAKEPMWDKVIAWQPLPQPYKAESEMEE